MIQTVVSRTKDLFGQSGAPEDEPEDTDPGDDVTTTIYSCQQCDRTYVSEDELSSCSNCGGSVEEVPNKYELGIT